MEISIFEVRRIFSQNHVILPNVSCRSPIKQATRHKLTIRKRVALLHCSASKQSTVTIGAIFLNLVS